MSKQPSKTVPHLTQDQPPEVLVRALKRQIARIETARRPRDEASVSSGFEALDRQLPGGGFHRGTLVEWLAAGEGSGVETLALTTAHEACGQDGTLVVFDRTEQFYPPAAARLGIELARLVVVRAGGEADNLWALDQALRSPGVAAVLAWPEKLDAHSFRRLQLAAEAEEVLGLFVRPEKVRHQPSWADVRLLVEPRPIATPVSGDGRLIRIQLLRCRGGTGRGQVEVEINHETHTLHPTSQLARRATVRRAAGA